LVTTKVNVTTSPGLATDVGLADFTSWIDGRAAAGTRVVSVAVTAGPDGGSPLAVAVLAIAPASTSACVTTYVAVHVVAAFGASVLTGQVTGDKPACGSVTPTECNVTLPVFETTYE
jgi:hypothetical protein